MTARLAMPILTGQKPSMVYLLLALNGRPRNITTSSRLARSSLVRLGSARASSTLDIGVLLCVNQVKRPAAGFERYRPVRRGPVQPGVRPGADVGWASWCFEPVPARYDPYGGYRRGKHPGRA